MVLARSKNTRILRFIAVESESLVIQTVRTVSRDNRELRVVKLAGTWRANEFNELCFDASAHNGPPQTFTFKGSWKLNKNQQISYTCGQGPDILVFKGYWDINSARRLVYILEGSSTSRFEFQAQIQTPNLTPKKGSIRFRLGTGVRRSRLSGGKIILSLFGEWKFGRDLGLNFKMDYGQGRVREIEFGARVSFGPNDLNFDLTNARGEPLGVSFTLSHKFLKTFDAQAFIKFKSLRSRQAVEAGIAIPF